MGDFAAAFGPALAFMLFPLMIPLVTVTSGALADALRRRREDPVSPVLAARREQSRVDPLTTG